MYSVHEKLLYLMTLIDKARSGWWSFPVRNSDLNQCPGLLQTGSFLWVGIKRTSTLNLVSEAMLLSRFACNICRHILAIA